MAHIVLLEPDALLSDTYAQCLSRAGHDVAQTFNAQSAIDAADNYQPQLVILELQIPAHNGIEFLYEFRSYAEWQHVPVIVQSLVPPHEFQASMALWNELGVTSYLYKPRASLRELLQAVKVIIPIQAGIQ